MVEITCLLCGERLTLPEYVHERYDGEVRCENCLGRLHVSLEGSKVRKYKVVREPEPFTLADFLKLTQHAVDERENGERG